MALPNGFLDELKSRLSLGQVAGRKVSWDARKSNPGKGDYWAPCPFHQEKTASFHVDDAKGFYYCFGCHAKGDAVNFVRETENLGFIEAVELLAQEAGMPVPEQDPKARDDAKKKATLHDVMELAVTFYRMQLNAAHAAEARAYIQSRGLSETALSTFEIGFAPSKRTALFEHLKSKNVSPEQMNDAGLIIQPDNGGTPFDRFRDRIMFPIRDARHRAIAFGGRAMSADAKAKYLNSPETALFDKGRTLYNLAPAREAAGKVGALIVAEGYMDVIALAEFGFTHSVAPLGTAITEDQVKLMWRFSDEPIVALDGDKAGVRAAMRLVDLALPLLTPGKSVRFAVMPDGLDPDDLLRASGVAGMKKLLGDTRSLSDMIWLRELEDRSLDSPDRKAAFDASLRKTLALIQDKSVREHYVADIKQRRSALFYAKSSPSRPQPYQAKTGRFSNDKRQKNGPTLGAKASYLARSSDTNAESRVREASILKLCVNSPEALVKLETEIETIPILSHDMRHVRDEILRILARMDLTDIPEDRIRPTFWNLITEFAGPSLSSMLDVDLQTKYVGEDGFSETTRQIQRHRAIIGRINETREAEAEISTTNDEGMTWRLQEAGKADENAARLETDDEASISEDEARKSQFLQEILDEAVRNSKKN